ncbi:MAG TPA: methylated-DNA--[protein]-cysteine S-methyltransferase [Acidiphilium sp.]|uniref:methylated-DNA--[protein]-cysteine S-methyltransferase n=1 Tax=unclassified Acidiphilium TaxID=2617493 RepID=UPI0025C44FC7|nr:MULTISPECIES: methylated-DNA--[protein]-cysteine S-methyltransferase [unclassified Acidiphilium]HQT59923.1 methylated-DNA--[protein]-cysteine S-methyltransferase [Acidiphilium sp.]HQU11844.1 methylated-DNA--[protein]-cysteine S-methyltransferase [Acidiphilium sp.]
MAQLSMRHPVFGGFILHERDGAIVSVDFDAGEAAAADAPTPLLKRAASALERYFDGDALDETLPLAPAGTDYQRRVWDHLRAIPRGQTRTYAEVARAVGGSARSVGGANRANPIPILIPCHRVRAADGLGGYCGSSEEGWGLAMKRRLLTLEGAAFGEPTRRGI